MTRQRLFGLLLIVIAILISVVLWWQEIKLIEIVQGAEVVIHKSETAPDHSVVSMSEIQLWPNWPAVFPPLLFTVAGLTCLLVPRRGTNA